MARKCTTLAVALVFGSSFLAGQTRSDSLVVPVRDTSVIRDYGWVSLQSQPQGAEVYLDSAFLGKTPLTRVRVNAGKTVFRFFYPQAGLWGATMNADSVFVQRGIESNLLVDVSGPLLPGPRNELLPITQVNPDLFLSVPGHGNSKMWLGSAAGVTMVISGVLSAYLKNKSDHEFDSYVATGDPTLLNSTQRLDRLAGVSLFVTEISLGVLIYLLLAD